MKQSASSKAKAAFSIFKANGFGFSLSLIKYTLAFIIHGKTEREKLKPLIRLKYNIVDNCDIFIMVKHRFVGWRNNSC